MAIDAVYDSEAVNVYAPLFSDAQQISAAVVIYRQY